MIYSMYNGTNIDLSQLVCVGFVFEEKERVGFHLTFKNTVKYPIFTTYNLPTERLEEERFKLIEAWKADVETNRITDADVSPASRVLSLIAAERTRQIEEEGHEPKGDDIWDEGQLAAAAATYATMASFTEEQREDLRDWLYKGDLDKFPSQFRRLRTWPWGIVWFNPKDRVRDLVRAGALIVAEIERLHRLRGEFDKLDKLVTRLRELDTVSAWASSMPAGVETRFGIEEHLAEMQLDLIRELAKLDYPPALEEDNNGDSNLLADTKSIQEAIDWVYNRY